jgi:hypothetical protein
MTRTADTARRTTRGRQLGTLLSAVAAALAVWVVSVPIAGLDLRVGDTATARTIGPFSVVMVSLLAGVAAWSLLILLDRHPHNGRRIWHGTALTVLALSLLGPVFMGASGGVLLSLIAMHLAVGATLILGLAPRRATE